jgi:RNA polymerase sigma factor (sigma-70 family)
LISVTTLVWSRAVRLRFRNDWRRRSYHDPDVELVEEDTYPLVARTWRRANATLRIVRRGWSGFTYHASANAVGTLLAISIAYLVSLAGGLVNAVPIAIVGSLVAIAAAVAAIIYRLAPRQLLRARATELLDGEPARIVETMKKIFAAPKSTFRVDLKGEESDWQILDALWDLPERERTIIAVRFGGHMTLADIGDALGISRERVRQLESKAIADVRESVKVAQDERRGSPTTDTEPE